jgi:integrase
MRHHRPEEDWPTGPIRNHRGDTRGASRLAGNLKPSPRWISVPQPVPKKPTFVNPPIPTHRDRWVESVGLDAPDYGTHSMRRTKAAQIYRKTGNLRAVQLLLGHTKLESTVRYLGVEVDDALSIAEQVEL